MYKVSSLLILCIDCLKINIANNEVNHEILYECSINGNFIFLESSHLAISHKYINNKLNG